MIILVLRIVHRVCRWKNFKDINICQRQGLSSTPCFSTHGANPRIHQITAFIMRPSGHPIASAPGCEESLLLLLWLLLLLGHSLRVLAVHSIRASNLKTKRRRKPKLVWTFPGRSNRNAIIVSSWGHDARVDVTGRQANTLHIWMMTHLSVFPFAARQGLK